MAEHPGFQGMVEASETWWQPGSYNRYFERVAFDRPTLEECALLWERRVRRIRDEASRLRPGTYQELRFEELTESPRASLDGVCTFVGLTTGPSWLAEAAAIVDPGRPRDTRAEWSAPSLPPSAMALLGDLGYERGAVPPAM
jgi:hypothetical protein